jgi:hypothetical protein
VLWWNLDPASGMFKRIAAPDGAPDKLLTPEVFQGFRFRFNVKGELRISD